VLSWEQTNRFVCVLQKHPPAFPSKRARPQKQQHQSRSCTAAGTSHRSHTHTYDKGAARKRGLLKRIIKKVLGGHHKKRQSVRDIFCWFGGPQSGLHPRALRPPRLLRCWGWQLAGAEGLPGCSPVEQALHTGSAVGCPWRATISPALQMV